MKKRPTISVGIPAHNEAQNIAVLLNSILKQQGSFVLEKILVVCDGCTDKTEAVVKKLAKTYPQIEVHNDHLRTGKATRLNEIYAWCSSDFLAQFDADVVLETENEIELMLKEALRYPKTKVIAGRLIPVKTHTIMGRAAEYSYKSFEDAVLRLNNGNNFYSLVGCASLIRKSFLKTVTYPTSVISDMNYLYALATRDNKLGVRLARKTRVLFRTVTTFHDWRVLAVRAVIEDKHNLTQFFGTDVLRDYQMPKSLLITSMLKWWLKSPVYMSISIIMNFYIRLFPLLEVMPHDGIWEDTRSSKEAIV